MERIGTAADRLCGAVLAALVALWIWRGFIGEGFGIFWLILLSFWQLVPVAGAAACVRASSTRAGAVAFLVVEAMLSLWTLGLGVATLVFDYSRLPTVGPIFDLYLFPVAQLIVLAIAFFLSILLGWRPREGWRGA